MTKSDKKNIRTFCIVSTLLIIAYVMRIIGNSDIYPKLCGILRALIYIGLYIVWGFSLRNRIIQKQARRYMSAIAFLMVFWFLVRTTKYNFVSAELYPDIARYLWYLFYLPMLFIPMFAVFVALSMGNPHDYPLKKKNMLLYIPTIILFLLVITNDFHRLVFTFPADATVWLASDHGYAIGYYMVLGWMFICALMTLYELWKKRRIFKKRIFFTIIPIIILVVYAILYYSNAEWVRFVAGDVTAIICLMYASILEICIRCGFIQANTHYRELFDASTVGVQIIDTDHKVFMSSKTAKPVDLQLLMQAEKAPVMMEDGVRLSGAPIHGGYVVWTEDMSPLLKVLDELKEVKENLEDGNAILEEENAVKAREAHIAEKERLYNIIQKDTAKQISLMDKLIEQTEESDDDEERVRLLKKMLVIGAYLKRRSNLVFLADKMSSMEPKELELTFGESLDNLEMYGITCGFYSELTKPVLSVHIIAMYDFFEEITERSLDCMSTLTVYAGSTKEGVFITINTDSRANLSGLLADSGIYTAVQDDDGEWKLTLTFGKEGDD